MKYAALFLWVLAPLGLWLAVTVWGTPHVLTTYRFHDNGDRWNPRAQRVYIDCTYVGWAGRITVPAEQGRCARVRFFRAEADLQAISSEAGEATRREIAQAKVIKVRGAL